MKKKTRWFVGIDWGNEQHFVCLLDEAGRNIGGRFFDHSGDGIAAICEWLFEQTSASSAESFFVAIETTRGALVETLLERGMVVHSINPKQLAHFRGRQSAAEAKDDRRDALVLAKALRTDPEVFRVLTVPSAAVIELREWTRIMAEVKQTRVQVSLRFRAQIHRYFPQILELAGADIASENFLRLWELVSTPAKAKRVRAGTIQKLLIELRIKRLDAAQALSTLRQTPLTVAPGTVEAATGHISLLIEQLRLINDQLKRAKARVDKITKRVADENKEQRDVDILRSLPGVGRMVLATLLTEAPEPLANRDYHALRLLSGVAPVTESSGKRSKKNAPVRMRRACNQHFRQAVHHWAGIAIRYDPKSRDHYAMLRARGHSHGRCARGIGDRLLKLACVLLKNQSLYDSERRQLDSTRQILG